MPAASDNGIYYFLGNITSHILHALPLQQALGGTFVVTSDAARKAVERLYGVPVINLDNRPYKWIWAGYRPKRMHHYITFDPALKKTYDYLNRNAKVVIFYELFEIMEPSWLENPKKIFLTHGNMLKSYMTMYPKRLEIVKQYDHMAALGPHMKQQFIKDGVNPDILVDIGVARTDEVIRHSGKVVVPPHMIDQLGIDPKKPIVSYMPTFWGASSIYTTGLEIVRHFPSDYTLIFRPHPQTPRRLLRQYTELIKSRPQVIYAPEGRYQNVGLVELFDASSIIIGDVSSVMLEAILTKKPLIFAYDVDEHQQSDHEYRSIKAVVRCSQAITPDRANDIPAILKASITKGIDTAAWQAALQHNFFNYRGDSVSSIKQFVESII